MQVEREVGTGNQRKQQERHGRAVVGSAPPYAQAQQDVEQAHDREGDGAWGNARRDCQAGVLDRDRDALPLAASQAGGRCVGRTRSVRCHAHDERVLMPGFQT